MIFVNKLLIMSVLILPVIGSAYGQILPSTGIEYYCVPNVNCPVYHAPAPTDTIWRLFTDPITLCLLVTLGYILLHVGWETYDIIKLLRKKPISTFSQDGNQESKS